MPAYHPVLDVALIYLQLKVLPILVYLLVHEIRNLPVESPVVLFLVWSCRGLIMDVKLEINLP